MCGIIALVRGPGSRRLLPDGDILDRLDRIQRAVARGRRPGLAGRIVAAGLAELDGVLRNTDGVALLVRGQDLVIRIRALCAEVGAWVGAAEARLDAGDATRQWRPSRRPMPRCSRSKDALWAVERDRLPTALAVRDAGRAPALRGRRSRSATSIQQALTALDRLEVRGRDSAGLTVLVHGHGLDLATPRRSAWWRARSADPLFRSVAVRTPEGHLSFVYKAAAEIGELGDNTRALRAAIAGDDLLRLALAADTASAVVLGHTRWASVGIISQPNAHPVDSLELERSATAGPTSPPPSTATSTTSPTCVRPTGCGSPRRSPPTPR